MARFFFDLLEDDLSHIDDEGTELDDAEAAALEAVHALAEIAADRLPGTFGKHLMMMVRDDDGHRLFELDLPFRFSHLN